MVVGGGGVVGSSINLLFKTNYLFFYRLMFILNIAIIMVKHNVNVEILTSFSRSTSLLASVPVARSRMSLGTPNVDRGFG